jgi:competence protein ComEC
MSQPLTSAVLLYVGGILLAYFVPLPLGWLFGVAIALALATLAISRARPFLLGGLLVACGWTNLTWQTAVLSPDDLRNVVDGATELVTLEGVLSETPSPRVARRGTEERWHSLALLNVRTIERDNQRRVAMGRVVVSTPGLLDEAFFDGQRVEIQGVIQPPKGPAAEGLFDYRSYLKWQGIHYQLRVENTNDWRLAAGADGRANPRWTGRFCQWAQKVMARGLPGEDESLRLLWAMALGWKTALTNEVSAPFIQTGTMHIFAISGLHIALIAGILVSVLRVVRLDRAACGWLVIPLIWFYTGATGWQSSAIRSALMMTIVIGGWALRRPGDLLNSLTVAGFILLLWEPQQLFQASFQLSFFVVLSIALILPPVEKSRQRLCKTDPLLPEELRRKWPPWVEWPVRFVTTSLATSLAACIGSMPLIAYYFHLVNPVSLLANLIIIPLSSLALMCNLGSLVCGDWLAPVTVLFNHSGWLWMELMVRLSEWMARWPGAYFYVRPPNAIEFFLFYGAVFAAVTGWLWAPRKRIWVGIGLSSLLGVCLWLWLGDRNTVKLTVMALSGGDTIFVDAPGRESDLLVDSGDASAADFLVKPFLGGQGVNRLNRCVLTHGDLRHCGGISNVIQEFPAVELLASRVRFRSPVYRKIIDEWEESQRQWRPIQSGERIGCWSVLHPRREDRFPLADDNAVVLRGEFHGVHVLLCSDLGRLGQGALLERGEDLRADVVVAGIPARNEPLQDRFLDAVQPQLIIISAAIYPANEQAKPLLRRRLARRGVPVLYTSDAGSITLRIRPRGWTVRAMNGAEFSGSKATDRLLGGRTPPAKTEE